MDVADIALQRVSSVNRVINAIRDAVVMLDLTEVVEVFADEVQVAGVFPATGQALHPSLSILRVAAEEKKAKGGRRGARLLLERQDVFCSFTDVKVVNLYVI